MTAKLMRVIWAGAIISAFGTYARFRSDMKKARAALKSGSKIAQTRAGPIEYGEKGSGIPLLVIHGAGGGYDQGLLIGRDLGEGFRIIAPSRFGYLRTRVPQNPSSASQADAHTALLDYLGIEKAIVLGASAGAPSAIELALRHPERVSHLILFVPRTYFPSQPVRADESPESQAILRLVEASADFLFWLATRISRRSVVRFLGVPPDVEAKTPCEERVRVNEIIRSIMPLSERVKGIALDSAEEISRWPLEKISCPVLIISAQDDLFKTLPGARFTAQQIPGAKLHVLKSGGHLMVGEAGNIRTLVRDFLEASRSPRKTADAIEQRTLEPA